jgi:hypothetical protein
MTTATTMHEPWCTQHVDDGPEQDMVGWCAARTITNRVEVEIVSDIETLDGATGIEIYAPGEHYLTADQVREVAAALLEAARIIEDEERKV